MATRKAYYLNGVEVARPKSLVISTTTYTPPTDEQLVSAGYEIREVEIPTYLPTLEELVERKLREQYSINQEFEVQRKRDSEPQAFETYYQYVEECIEWAEAQPHRDELA